MQVNCGNARKYLGKTLANTTVGQVKIIQLDHINEILNDFDKADPTGGFAKSSAAPSIFKRSTKTVKTLISSKPWSFIIWW